MVELYIWRRNMSNNRTAFLFLALCAATLLMPELALALGGGGGGGAGGDSIISGVLCAAVGWLTGNTGAGIATLAIIIIGIGALLGKVSWGMAIIVGIGVAVVFGAPTLVQSLGGKPCG
jgi:type IV secretion system protein VirB2